MAWFVTVREGSHPGFTFEDGFETEQLSTLRGSTAIADPSKLPTSAKADDKRQFKTDVVMVSSSFSGGGAGAVASQDLRDAIETVEPGVHQFFPMVLKQQDGTPFDRTFYLMRVRRRFPCVLFLESDHQPIGSVMVQPNFGQPIYNCHDTDLAISKPAMAGHHLFSTSIVAGGKAIMSDALMTECKRRKISGFRAHSAKELDRPWDAETEVPEYMQWLRDHPDQAPDHQRFFVGIRA
jgi:hypothetical protein